MTYLVYQDSKLKLTIFIYLPHSSTGIMIAAVVLAVYFAIRKFVRWLRSRRAAREVRQDVPSFRYTVRKSLKKVIKILFFLQKHNII